MFLLLLAITNVKLYYFGLLFSTQESNWAHTSCGAAFGDREANQFQSQMLLCELGQQAMSFCPEVMFNEVSVECRLRDDPVVQRCRNCQGWDEWYAARVMCWWNGHEEYRHLQALHKFEVFQSSSPRRPDTTLWNSDNLCLDFPSTKHCGTSEPAVFC